MRALVVLGVATACGRSNFDDVTRGDARPDSVPPGFCQTATFANPPASSMQDDFTTPYTDRWAPINPSAPCINQMGTELVATPPGFGEFCYAFTTADFHLTCDSIFVRVPQVTSPELGVQTLIYVSSVTTGENFDLLFEAGGLQMGPDQSPPTVYAPYDPMLDVWWRLGERDGEVIFETAPDGVAWRELMRLPTPFSFDRVLVAIGAGTYKPIVSPGQARFRCYNVPPPCN